MKLTTVQAQQLGITVGRKTRVDRRSTGPSVAVAQIVAYCGSYGLPLPKPEHEFHPVRQWAFDLAWVELKVALELEGITGGKGGRHQRRAGYSEDCVKYSEAALLGWVVLRATYGMLERGVVWGWLDRAIHCPTPLVHPCAGSRDPLTVAA